MSNAAWFLSGAVVGQIALLAGLARWWTGREKRRIRRLTKIVERGHEAWMKRTFPTHLV